MSGSVGPAPDYLPIPRRGKRGAAKFYYTLKEVGDLTGVKTPETRYYYKKKGQLDVTSLTSIVNFCCEKAVKEHSKRRMEAEHAALTGDHLFSIDTLRAAMEQQAMEEQEMGMPPDAPEDGEDLF